MTLSFLDPNLVQSPWFISTPLLWPSTWQIPLKIGRTWKIYKQLAIYWPFRASSPLFTVPISTPRQDDYLCNTDKLSWFDCPCVYSLSTRLSQQDVSLSSTAFKKLSGHGRAQHWCPCLCLELHLINSGSSTDSSTPMIFFFYVDYSVWVSTQGETQSRVMNDWLKIVHWSLHQQVKLEQQGHKYRGEWSRLTHDHGESEFTNMWYKIDLIYCFSLKLSNI